MVMLQLTTHGAALAEESIWTNRPVRIDRATQNFERLPNLVLGLEGGESISFPARVDMHDSASFSAGGVEYVLADLKPVAADRVCRTGHGVRWSCGAQASVFVGNLFRGRTLVCKVGRERDRVALSGCRTTGMRISPEIVSRGHAFPIAGDSDLEAALLRAKAQGAGVWKDADCLMQNHSC